MDSRGTFALLILGGLLVYWWVGYHGTVTLGEGSVSSAIDPGFVDSLPVLQ